MTSSNTTLKTLYTASATATGDGRAGHARSSDGILDVDLAIPAELGGSGGAATNPEQLFAAGYAACFHSALKNVARAQHVKIDDSAVTADVDLTVTAENSFQLVVRLDVELSGMSLPDAEALTKQAHSTCPYSRAINGNVDVTVSTSVA